MPAIDITGLALHPLDTPCDGCGHHAVELVVTRESDEITDTGCITLRYCRVCDPDGFCEPGAEILTGDPVDAPTTTQLGMFEIAPTSTAGPRDREPTPGQLTF